MALGVSYADGYPVCRQDLPVAACATGETDLCWLPPIPTGSSGMASTYPNPQQFLILMLHAHPRMWQGGSQSPLCLGGGERGLWGSGSGLLLTRVQVLLLTEVGENLEV